MATVKTHPQKQSHIHRHRPFTGSMLFPDLVWTHWAWQSRARPHAFPRQQSAWRLLASVARRNGRPDRAEKTPLPAPSEAEISRLKEDYERAVAAFERKEGQIIRAYWCSTEASAVVLTEKQKRWSRIPWRRLGNLRLHRETEWVTAQAPEIAELLHSGDTLSIRINRVLTQVPRRIAMEWVFSEQSYLLGFVERMGGRPSRKDTASVIARHQLEIDRLERYYDRAANKAARIQYFLGMILGLIFVGVLGALIPAIIHPFFHHLDYHSPGMRAFYLSYGAGAVGAIVSVMTRMRQAEGVTLDYEVGRALIVMLGGFRPILGAVFGVLAFFALQSHLLVAPPDDVPLSFYCAFFAFAAGFSERFAHVILGSADLTVAKGLKAEDAPEEAKANQPRPPPAPPPAVPATTAGKEGPPAEKPKPSDTGDQ
jgi:hypothetical protein